MENRMNIYRTGVVPTTSETVAYKRASDRVRLMTDAEVSSTWDALKTGHNAEPELDCRNLPK